MIQRETSTIFDLVRQIKQNKKLALGLVFAIMLMDVMGITLLFPVSAYIVRQYSQRAFDYILLNVLYSAAQFFAAPVLGKLSDRVGRRPVLLLCLAGSAAGYLMFGVGGALSILFLSRIIAGITGGSLSTASAYLVDVSKPEELSKNLTLNGMAWGVGLVAGPALGGLLGQINLSAPAFSAAVFSMVNLALGLFVLPESLPLERRECKPMRARDFNVLSSIWDVGKLPHLGFLLAATAAFNFGFNGMNSTESLFIIQVFSAQPWQLGLLTMLIGMAVALVQAILVPRLVPVFGEKPVAITCLLIQAASVLAVSVNRMFVLVYPILVLRSAASGLIFPTLGALAAKRVSPSQQGLLMGVTTGINSLMGVISPILAGMLFDQAAPGAPYWMAAALFTVSALILRVPGKSNAPTVSRIDDLQVP